MLKSYAEYMLHDDMLLCHATDMFACGTHRMTSQLQQVAGNEVLQPFCSHLLALAVAAPYPLLALQTCTLVSLAQTKRPPRLQEYLGSGCAHCMAKCKPCQTKTR